MADFFSQFQVHPPQVPTGPNMGNEGQYSGQFTGLNGGPIQDFNLGGFQQQDRTPVPGWTGGPITTGQPYAPGSFSDLKNTPLLGQTQTPSDPRVSTQPQPWLPGPNMGNEGQYPGVPIGAQPQPYQQGPGGIPRSPYENDWNYRTNPLPAGFNPQQAAQDAQTNSPWVLPGNDQAFNQAQGQPAWGSVGSGLGSVAQWMQGNNAPIEQQMAQTNGVSPAALQSLGQPMNPSQQSGMVLMRSPDGLHMQNVPQEHVAHYTGLGATQVTGPQLTGSSYGGGNGQ
jgi:hypothetical protein